MKSPFWTYFHDKLNWLPIFRPGPVSALMRGLALHMDEVRQDILWLREQWNPATCEIWLLERYGASRGIFRTRFDTDESYRKRVIYAYAWHKLGGKVRGLEKILADSGFIAQISNSDESGLWAHFRIMMELGDKIFDEDEASFFWFLVNEYKPARSVVEYLRTKAIREIPARTGAGSLEATRVKLYSWRWQSTCEPVKNPVITGSLERTKIRTRPVQRLPDAGFFRLPGRLAANAITRANYAKPIGGENVASR